VRRPDVDPGRGTRAVNRLGRWIDAGNRDERGRGDLVLVDALVALAQREQAAVVAAQLDHARQLRDAEERGHLGRHLPGLRVERLAPAEDEVDAALLLDRERERSRGAERVGEGEDAVGEVDRAVRAEREAFAERIRGLRRPHRHRDHLAAGLPAQPHRGGDRVPVELVQLERDALTLEALRLLVELDRIAARHLLDEADDFHGPEPNEGRT
jgi:hypothetical protein